MGEEPLHADLAQTQLFAKRRITHPAAFQAMFDGFKKLLGLVQNDAPSRGDSQGIKKRYFLYLYTILTGSAPIRGIGSDLCSHRSSAAKEIL